LPTFYHVILVGELAMLMQKAQKTYSMMLKNLSLIAAAAVAVCTFFAATPAKAVVVDYASCISSPLPNQPRLPFYSFRVLPSNGTATGGFDAYFWRESCTSKPNLNLLMMHIIPFQGNVPQVCPSNFQLIQFGTLYEDLQLYPSPATADPVVCGPIYLPTTYVLGQAPIVKGRFNETGPMTIGFAIGNLLGSVSLPGGAAFPTAASSTVNYSDMWWNPEQSGWGMSVIQSPSRNMFVVWYTYETVGTEQKSAWIVMPGGEWTDATTFKGKLYKTVGGALPTSSTFNPNDVTRIPFGDGEFKFTDSANAKFSFTTPSGKGEKSITRQAY
jgi:hypothetical protein